MFDDRLYLTTVIVLATMTAEKKLIPKANL